MQQKVVCDKCRDKCHIHPAAAVALVRNHEICHYFPETLPQESVSVLIPVMCVAPTSQWVLSSKLKCWNSKAFQTLVSDKKTPHVSEAFCVGVVVVEATGVAET